MRSLRAFDRLTNATPVYLSQTITHKGMMSERCPEPCLRLRLHQSDLFQIRVHPRESAANSSNRRNLRNLWMGYCCYSLSMPQSFPEWIRPMAATLTQERFNGAEWIFERKFDGIRLIAYKKGSQVELFSRNRLSQTIPALARAIAKLPHKELILDGEIDWHGPSAYHVFDIMWLDGRDLTNLPLEERRALLGKLPLGPPLHRVTALHDEAPWERAQNQGWEGVIAKRRDSVYEQRRSPNWLKMKCELA